MTTYMNGTEFKSAKTRTFAPTFEGAQARREKSHDSLISKRQLRRDRRANRAI